MNAAFQIPRTALIWILCSLVLVTLPHVLRMPLWISLMCLLCVAWRILIFIGKIDYPGRLTRFLIVIFTVLAVVVQFRDLGLDSAVGLLLLGFIFKLLEMKDKRDIYIVISLGYVMSMVVFIYSQSIAATIYVLFVIVVITAAMISVNQSADNSGVINTVCYCWDSYSNYWR